jgi:alpha-L-fucosidase 2
MPARSFATGLVIRDDGAASEWNLAYPVGNGRLGALPFGGFPSERILLNEETIWSRSGPMLTPEESFEHLEAVRRLEAAGDYQAADRYFVEHLQDGQDPDSYQLAGWLELEYIGTSEHRSTQRELDLETGISRSVHTLADGSRVVQEVFASGPDDVVVITVTAGKPFGLRVSLAGSRIEDDDIVLDGAGTGDDATRFRARARVTAADEVRPVGGGLEIAAARRITIAIAVATDLDRSRVGEKRADGWQREALETLERIAKRSPESLEELAVADHRRFFDRLQLDLGATPDEVQLLPTRARLQRVKDGAHDDPDLVET